MKIEKEIKARYRNKLKKIVIEVWNGKRWIYVKTLADPMIEFKEICLAKVSSKHEQNEEKDGQKFLQSPLTAPENRDISGLIPSEEQMKKLLEMSKE